MDDINAKLHDALVSVLPRDTAFVLVYASDDERCASLSNLHPELAKELVSSVISGPPLDLKIVDVTMDC